MVALNCVGKTANRVDEDSSNQELYDDLAGWRILRREYQRLYVPKLISIRFPGSQHVISP